MLGHSHEFDIHHGIIVGEYFIIAIQFLTVFVSVKKKGKGHWAAAFMVCIFTMCAFVGYVVDMVNVNKILHFWFLNFHVLLCMWFIHKNHAQTLINSIDSHEIDHD